MVNPIEKRQTASSRMERSIEQSVTWIEHNQETFWGIVGGVLLIGVFLGFVVHQRGVTNNDAWLKLGAVQSQAMQGHLEEERKGLADWEIHFSGSSAAAYAKFLQADLLVKTSDYAGASSIYGDLAQNAYPVVMRSLALSSQATTEELAGHIPQALTLAKHFTDQYPDHFLAGSMYLTAARLSEATGDVAAASALYDRIILLYPQSPWIAIAHSRIQALTPAGAGTASSGSIPSTLSVQNHP